MRRGLNHPGLAALAAQAFSSATNAGTVLLVSHQLGPVDFGKFALLWLITGTALGAWRTLIADPSLAVDVGAGTERWALTLGSIGAGAVFLAARALGLPIALVSVTAIGLLLSILLDARRYEAFRSNRLIDAVRLDACWLVVVLVALPASLGSAVVAVGAWAFGAACGLIVSIPLGLARQSVFFRLGSLHSASLASFVFVSAQSYGLFAIVGWGLGLASLGEWRAATVFAMPLVSLSAGLRVVLIPRFGAPHSHSVVIRWALGIFGAGIAWSSVILLASMVGGLSLLGGAVGSVSLSVLGLTLLQGSLVSSHRPFLDGILASPRPTQILRTRLVLVALVLSCAAIGIILGRLEMFLAFWCAATLVGCFYLSLVVRRSSE